jgi:arylsulfatase A
MSEPERPNIVLILADDLGYGDLSCLNSGSRIPTPRIDALAVGGMVFEDAHSTSSVCTPSRYSLLTGRYCWRTELKSGVLWGYDPHLIEPGRLTLPQMLQANGYATACIGKWHLGLGWDIISGDPNGVEADPKVNFGTPLSAGPHTAGFGYSYIIPASLDMPPYCYIEDGIVVEAPTERIADSPRPAYYRGGNCATGFSHESCLLELTKQAEGFISGHRLAHPEQPFFLYFPLTSPHTPHMPRAPFRGKSQAGEYGDFVVETDWCVGRIMDTLDRHGCADNTLFVFTSDNGCHASAIGLEERFGHLGNYVFRGQKSDAWDGGHRIPLIVRWPNQTPAGSTCSRLVSLSDLMATCAAIVGQALPDDAAEDSYNVWPYLLGRQEPVIRPELIHHSIYGHFAVREHDWKLVMCRGSGGWSLEEREVPADAPPMQLYNLLEDVREQQNLYHRHPDIVTRLANVVDEAHRLGRTAPRTS